eukprot:tig00000293_g23884.t1
MTTARRKLVAAIDQGTTSTRVIAFDEGGNIVAKCGQEFPQIYPNPGWCEHDPEAILESARSCLAGVASQLAAAAGVDPASFRVADFVAALGVTNQRETTIVWDRETGRPLHNAIVWLDTRTTEIAERLEAQLGSSNALRDKCGLPISTYFSALKLRWLIDNCEAVRSAVAAGTCVFGTVDSWLLWNLTKGPGSPPVHATDVTNASRTMLMNIRTCKWDPELCSVFGIPENILPEIRSCSEFYGVIASGPFSGVPITGMIGDQQGATMGQACFKPGEAKNTYGTGCFVLMNTGTEPVQSTHGLLTTVAYQLGPRERPVYALEARAGSVAIAGAGIQWLRDNMKMISQASEIEDLAGSVPDAGGMYFVPAFSGLFAPYWRRDARGAAVGLTQYVTRAHFARAVLESVCFQTREVLEAMEKDSGVRVHALKADGGMSVNALLMQMQADVLGVPVATL